MMVYYALPCLGRKNRHSETFNHGVVGSSPTALTKKIKDLAANWLSQVEFKIRKGRVQVESPDLPVLSPVFLTRLIWISVAIWCAAGVAVAMSVVADRITSPVSQDSSRLVLASASSSP